MAVKSKASVVEKPVFGALVGALIFKVCDRFIPMPTTNSHFGVFSVLSVWAKDFKDSVINNMNSFFIGLISFQYEYDRGRNYNFVFLYLPMLFRASGDKVSVYCSIKGSIVIKYYFSPLPSPGFTLGLGLGFSLTHSFLHIDAPPFSFVPAK